MAAAVLAKALGRTCGIRLVESDAIGTVGVGEATIPQIQHINRFLGFEENDFLRATNGSLKLGIQFNNWAREGDSYLHAFGDFGTPFGLVDFYHYWLRAKASGSEKDLWEYCLNARAARENKFAPMETLGRSNVTGIRHAYHFDASLYAQYLRKASEAMGVSRIEGKITSVEQNAETGFIESVTLERGETLNADLFIDCSGFRGLLIEDSLNAGYEDWTHWLPCDRAVAVPCAHGSVFRPYTQATARQAGWQWRIPLQHRVGNGHVFSSAHMSEDEATQILLDNLEGEPGADPRVIRFTTGRRKSQWLKNVISLGLASGFMEPLESTSIHLVQSGINRLLACFPHSGFDPDLTTEYNRQSKLEFESIRDFLILHYHATERDDTAFWRMVRDMDVPESVTRKMELFRTSGRVFREGDELFTEPGWLQVMLGQRVVPEAYHPLANSLPEKDLAGLLDEVDRIIGHATSQMPSHADYIKQHCGEQPKPQPQTVPKQSFKPILSF